MLCVVLPIPQHCRWKQCLLSIRTDIHLPFVRCSILHSTGTFCDIAHIPDKQKRAIFGLTKGPSSLKFCLGEKKRRYLDGQCNHTVTQPWLMKPASSNLESPAASWTDGALPVQSNSGSIFPSANVSNYFLNPCEPFRICNNLKRSLSIQHYLIQWATHVCLPTTGSLGAPYLNTFSRWTPPVTHWRGTHFYYKPTTLHCSLLHRMQ